MDFPLKLVLFIFFPFLACTVSIAQQASISGEVMSNNEILVGASIYINDLQLGTRTDVSGKYLLKNVPSGNYEIRVSFVGYVTVISQIEVKNNENTELDFNLETDALNMSEVVVSATRNEISRYDAPVIIQTISNRTFEATQSLSIAEGLSFSPGLRLENNCQNCGFTQLRMNGLDGAYSQILINSRPIFSALAGVYGLEMLPANMVERIEIIRGGGSVLFGGNAIAGTVNIITKDPIQNSFEVGFNQSFINLNTPDRTLTFNASLVSDDFKKGITFFALNRARKPWDANNDDFSEITELRNSTMGFDAFWDIKARSKLKLGVYLINEFRRGGNGFDLEPHQTALSEQLRHNIVSFNASFEHYSKNYRHKLSTYLSAQTVDRNSYYGAGGSLLSPNDSLSESQLLALNAYGNSDDISAITGVQYSFEITENIMLTSGSEFNINRVRDAMPGYNRRINQTVGTLGNYIQFELNPIKRLKILIGGRLDYININGNHELQDYQFRDKKSMFVAVPRISSLYSISPKLKIRASFAQGYRAPQAFNEDLHIETVGGAAKFIRLDSNLVTERSNSYTLSLNYDKMHGKKQFNVVVEGFYTQLNNPFILSDQQELDNGVAVITKRNGSGAYVLGSNLEFNVAIGQKWIIQSGATIQLARYNEQERIWQPIDPNDTRPATSTTSILRTPNQYGYLTLIYKPNKNWMLSYSSVYTGQMTVAHVINASTEETVLKTTPQFIESNIKIAYTLQTKDAFKIQFFVGMQNILNSYQQDFDSGMNRDAGYIYGPNRPRTIFAGVKFGMG